MSVVSLGGMGIGGCVIHQFEIEDNAEEDGNAGAGKGGGEAGWSTRGGGEGRKDRKEEREDQSSACAA